MHFELKMFLLPVSNAKVEKINLSGKKCRMTKPHGILIIFRSFEALEGGLSIGNLNDMCESFCNLNPLYT